MMLYSNPIINIFKNFIIHNQIRHSALFINGAKATEQFVYVTPHVNTQEILENTNEIQKQLNKRNLPIDLQEIQNLWTIYNDLKTQKDNYDQKKAEISKELGLMIKNNPENNVINKLKIQLSLIKENLKKLKVPLWSAENAAMIEMLKLPNNLHVKTPTVNSNVIFSHLSPTKGKKNHVHIGENLNLLKIKTNGTYYLSGDAAIYELGAKFYFSNVLKKNHFIQFSNADFVKSLIVEGCGNEHTNADSSFILHHNEDTSVNIDNRLHLTGGASLCSFLAYHTKNVLYPKVLPLKYFTIGRQYIPCPSKEDSLFHVSQSSAIEVFGVTKTASDLDTMLDELINVLKGIYIKLGYHFRLSIIPAEKLHMWESLRVAIEMYSPSVDDYVEVGNVSLSGDFISKRLMFTYVENKNNKFPYILSGSILNIPRFIGCVLEQDIDFHIPEPFRVENWTLNSI